MKEHLLEFMNALIVAKKLDENAFFKNFDKLSNEQLLKMQKDFIHVINFWPQALSILLYKMDDPGLRITVMENLNDEHGHGDITKSYLYAFHKHLLALGYDGDFDIPQECSTKAVIVYIKTLEHYLMNLGYAEGSLILGAIEYIHTEICKRISGHLQSRGIPNEYYTVIDKKHVNNLFSVALTSDQLVNMGNEYIYDLLIMGYMELYSLYDGLYKESKVVSI